MIPEAIPTPAILIDATVARNNLARMAAYAQSHTLALRPHTKTHKSRFVGRMQIEAGARGLTVAKAGEAQVMAEVTDDLLMAYPAVDPGRCQALARFAGVRTVRVGVDSPEAVDALASAARSTGVTIGILVDLDVGHHRTGTQNTNDALALAQHVSNTRGLRLDGIMFFPGHLNHVGPGELEQGLRRIDEILAEALDQWQRGGLNAGIVSGGSTPSASRSHLVSRMNEIRPGTYVYNDMNCVHVGSAALGDCAARIISTVVSTAVPGQVVLDAGSKTLTSDKCGPAPDSGHGHILEYPDAKITKLSEEHAQVDVTRCDRPPKLAERVSIIPNHICPCINLQDTVWWLEPGSEPQPMAIDARGQVH